jgi:hypothetical protein
LRVRVPSATPFFAEQSEGEKCRAEAQRRQAASNLVILFALQFLHAAKRKIVPDAFVDVIQADFREQFHAADGQRPFQFSRDEKRNDQRVHAAGEPPRDGFDQTAVMLVGHAAKR